MKIRDLHDDAWEGLELGLGSDQPDSSSFLQTLNPISYTTGLRSHLPRIYIGT